MPELQRLKGRSISFTFLNLIFLVIIDWRWYVRMATLVAYQAYMVSQLQSLSEVDSLRVNGQLAFNFLELQA